MPGRRYTVLIPTAGVGAQLGAVTDHTNMSLIKIGRKPALSYIIEAYPRRTRYVVALGHFGDHVREFVRLAYPGRDITFVEVDTYDGPGSSLGYTMLQTRRWLREPFIYHAGDTIVLDKVPLPTRNWVGGFKAEGSSSYASFDVFGGAVRHIHEKGVTNPDYLHIGLVGVQDYQRFWAVLERLCRRRGRGRALGDMHVVNEMIAAGSRFALQRVGRWYDVGNLEGLSRLRDEATDAFPILDKQTESIYLFDGFVVKFFADQKMVRDRVRRARHLRGLVPAVEGSTPHFYRYRLVPGELFSSVANARNFAQFLSWAQEHLWQEVREVSAPRFAAVCRSFYERKTRARVREFLQTRHLLDREDVINGERVPAMEEVLRRVDFSWLARTPQRTFHGDLVLDNIIKTKDGFCLLDWRQNFGGLLKAGDQYYDLAKLNHNLTVNHQVVHDNLFTIDVAGREVQCNIMRRQTLVDCQHYLFEFLAKRGYDQRKVKVLTGLIWLNMSPLHHHPFDLFLYYFGKLKLWQAVHEA